MYIKNFEIRWSDIDANRHLANSAYLNFTSHTRMSFLIKHGLSQKELVKHNIGPVVFYEHIYYFKEIFPGKPIQVSLELAGLSKGGMFFQFIHNFYNHEGKNMAHSEMMGAWIDLKTRKLIDLPEELHSIFGKADHSSDFKVLTKEDTRKYAKKPKDLD